MYGCDWMGWGEWDDGNKEITAVAEISKTNNGFRFHLTKFIEDTRSYRVTVMVFLIFKQILYTATSCTQLSRHLIYYNQAENVKCKIRTCVKV